MEGWGRSRVTRNREDDTGEEMGEKGGVVPVGEMEGSEGLVRYVGIRVTRGVLKEYGKHV